MALVSLADTSFAQKNNEDSEKVTLHNYMFAITDEFQLYLEDLAEDNVEPVSGEKDPVAELFMHKSYEQIEAAIEAKTDLDILPKETLEGKVLYDIYGYPFATKKKAVKKGNTPYYMKLYVQMSARDMIDEEIDVNDNSYKKRKIKAHVIIKATVFDDKCKVVSKIKGTAKGDRWIVLDRASLFGFIYIEGQTVVDEQSTLLSVLDEAIEDLKTKLPSFGKE